LGKPVKRKALYIRRACILDVHVIRRLSILLLLDHRCAANWAVALLLEVSVDTGNMEDTETR